MRNKHRRPRHRRLRREDTPTILVQTYRVFNLEQCELPRGCSTSCRRSRRTSTIQSKRQNRSSRQCPIRRKSRAGTKAFYTPITDRVTLPPRELFMSAEEYYATALHALGLDQGSGFSGTALLCSPARRIDCQGTGGAQQIERGFRRPAYRGSDRATEYRGALTPASIAGPRSSRRPMVPPRD